MKNKIKIIAHRGNGPTSNYSGAPDEYVGDIAPADISDVPEGLAPENSLKAIRKAIDEGADGAEFDVYYAKNGIVVIHDNCLNLNVRGANRKANDLGNVTDKTVEELQQYDVGQGEKIPTLQEILDLVSLENVKRRKLGKEDFILKIEFKDDPNNLMEGVEQTFSLVEQYVNSNKIAESSIFYGSFSHEALYHIDKIGKEYNRKIQILPQLTTDVLFGKENVKMPGWVVDKNQPYSSEAMKKLEELAQNPSVYAFDVGMFDVNDYLVELAQKYGKVISFSSSFRDFTDSSFADRITEVAQKIPVLFLGDEPKELREIIKRSEYKLNYSAEKNRVFEDGRILKSGSKHVKPNSKDTKLGIDKNDRDSDAQLTKSIVHKDYLNNGGQEYLSSVKQAIDSGIKQEQVSNSGKSKQLYFNDRLNQALVGLKFLQHYLPNLFGKKTPEIVEVKPDIKSQSVIENKEIDEKYKYIDTKLDYDFAKEQIEGFVHVYNNASKHFDANNTKNSQHKDKDSKPHYTNIVKGNSR